MKNIKKLLLSGAVLLAGIVANAQTPSITPGGPTAICLDQTVSLTVVGAAGKAIQVSGTAGANQGYVNVPDANSLDFTTAYTLEAWINPSAYASNPDNAIVSKNRSNGGGGYSLSLEPSTGKLIAGANNGLGRNEAVSSSAAVPLNTWSHVAGVFNGTSLTLYINGVQAGQKTFTSFSLANSTQPLRIGMRGPGLEDWLFNGQIDEVRVWSTARTQVQISDNMGKEIAPQTGLVGYYKMNEGTGTSVADASGSANTGTLSGTNYAWVANSGATMDFNSYAWSPGGATTKTVTGNPVNTYIVTVTNGAGTTATASQAVTLGAGCASGAALDLDGTNDYVALPSAVYFSGNLTFESWVYPKSFNSWSRIIDIGNGPGIDNVFLSFGSATAPGKPILGFANSGVNATQSLPLNQWSHVAAVLNGTTATLYINGVVAGTSTIASGDIPANVVRTLNYIGRSNYVADGYANAKFDEVRIWNVARTQAQLQTSMNCELAGTESGLVAYYKFNQSSGTTLTDATSNGRNGTLTNFALTGSTSNWGAPGAVTTGAICTPGVALNFDGTDDFVNGVKNDALRDMSALTLEAWIKSNAPGRSIVSYDGNSHGAYRFELTGDGKLTFSISHNGSSWEGVTGNTIVPQNVWNHVAAVWVNTTLNIYLNGVLDGTASTASTPLHGTDPEDRLRIGRDGWDSAPNYFLGTMDEVRIWSIARTALQIQGNMNCELNTSETGLKAYYRFNQGIVGANNASAATLIDSSSNGFTGTLTNFALTGSTSNWVAPGGVTTGTSCPPPISVTISGNTTSCGSTILTAIGGSTYVWSTGATTAAITVSATGTYTVTATGTNGSTAIASQAVTINTPPGAGISGTTTACDQVSLTAGPSGMTSYLWSNGSTTATATFIASGTYTVTITDANGCTATASQTVTVNKATATLTGPATACDAADLIATGGIAYAWTGGGSGSTKSYTAPGTYTVTVTDANGCTASAMHTVFIVQQSKIYYLDADGDGYGDSNNPTPSCDPLPGYILVGADCDDTNPAINPGAVETCDDIDNNCNGILIETACGGSGTEVSSACAARSTVEVLTGRVFFNYGSTTNARQGTTRSSHTIGQPTVGVVLGDELNLGFGFWTRFLLAPSAPVVRATEGNLFDRIEINWSPNPLSPAASAYNLYRDGSLLATVDNDIFAFIDFNVLAGQFYKYEVSGKNQFGEGDRGSAPGFLNPNGVVTGQIKTFSGNPVAGAVVKLSPTLGAAMSFNGISTVFTEPVPEFPRNKFTLSCWVKQGDGNDGAGIFDLGSSIGKNWWLHTLPAGTAKGIKFGIGKNLTTKTELSFTFPDSTKNDWHYIAASYNGASLLLYVDGELVSTAVGEIAASDVALFIGKHDDEGGYFNGKIDELRFFNRQLPQTEIQMTMNQTVSASTPGLISYWKFDEGSGSKAFDLSVRKTKAHLCGATWTTDKPAVVNAGISDATGFYKIEGVNYGPGTTFTAQPYKNFYFNQSLEFNAANSTYAELTNFDLPDSTTIEITVKNFDFSATQTLLSKQDGPTTHFSLNLIAGNVFLEMGGTSHNFGALGMGFYRLSFVMKQTGGSMEVTYYKNGTLIGTNTFSGVAASFAGGSPWTLGARLNGADMENYFTGLIDEVAFFSTLLPLPDIQTYTNIGTSVTNPNLKNYFNLNEGEGTVLSDMGTGLSGKGSIHGATFSTVAAVSEILPHKFTPSTRLVTLNPSNTSSDQIDFTDQSTIPVSGYVRFENTDCFQKGVEILVNGKSLVPQVLTDEDGKFTVDLEPGQTVRLTPKFEIRNSQTGEAIASHSFYPAFWDLTSVSSPVAGILFRNQTKRKVFGQMAGNETCRKSVIQAGAIVKVKVSTLNGCYEQVKQLPENGKFVFEGVPPDSVTVAVIEHSNPIIYTFFQNLGGATLDLKMANDTANFIYLAPPQVEISALDTNLCGNPMFEIASSSQVNIRVFEQYDGGVCYLDTALLTINNEIADLEQFDTLMTKGVLKHKFKSGKPNIVPPYLKNLQVTAKAHDELSTLTRSAVVLGKRARDTQFASTSPQLPTLILRDPPGDASVAYLEKGETTCNSWTFTATNAIDESANLNVSLGPDLTTSVGFISETELEVDATVDIGFEHTGTFNTLVTNEMETCMTTTELFSTSDNDLVVGSKMGGDLYVGGALNLLFGISDNLLFDTATCGFVLDKGLIIVPEGFATTFIYSEYQILNNVIPDLLLIGDTTSASRWQDIVNRNTLLKQQAVFSKNISFDGGVVYEQSETSESTQSITYEYTQEFSNTFSGAYGIQVNGVGVVAGASIGWTIGTSNANTNTNMTSRTVGFTLADDDIGDNFTVNIKKDKVYGTPVFDLVSGQSQCPHEPNTQPREGVSIAADAQVAVNVPMNDVAVFKLTLGNTSQSEETRVYSLEGLQENNPDGAVIRFNGQPTLSVAVPFGQPVVVTMTVARGPVAFDYENLRIGFFSDCEVERADALGIDPPAEQNKEMEFDVHFIEPCSPVGVGSPLQDWVFLSTSGTFLNITVDSYDKTDPDLELIRVQYRRSQGDGAWINIAELPKADLGPVFTLVPWNLPGSFKDGYYEIRAVTQCFSGALNPGISYVIKGRIEREPPALFGTPEPADGVLSAGDEISIQFTEPIRCDQIIQADDSGNNNIGLYNTETGRLVDATITCQGDKIIIVPNVPNRFIENKILRVEVDNIKDLAGNLFVHKSWEFVVDRNPVHWEGGKVKVTKYKEEIVKVTRRIVNEGGQATDYLIEGVPSWVRVYPLGGNLLPGASEEITFEFNDQLAYGSFADTISIDPPGGFEPLIVNCRVMCKSPEWEYDAPAYSQTMNFAVKLNIEGTLSTDEEDIVAAFIDGQVRGTAKVQLLPTLPPLGTQYMAFLTVYGNDDDYNKPVHLEIWDASECLRYGQVVELFNFEADNVIGTVGSPQVIHTNSLVRRDIPINNGWNWLSFNLDFPNPALNQSLVSLLHPENDLIKSQSGFAEYYGTSWLGSLTQLNNTGMFQFRADTPDTIQMIGTLIDPDSLSIPITSGWNWIGYIPNYPLPVSQALAGLTALNGDIIKGQTAFAQYLAGFGWLGSLQYLEPPKGYQLKISYPGTLTYPHQNLVAQTVDARGLPNRVENHWTVNPSTFEYSMTLVGMLQVNGQNATLEQHELGVFAGNELRGSATAIYVEPLHAYMFFLTMYSNTPGELLRFKLYNSASGQESNLVESMYFSDNNHQGSIESPVPFTLQSSAVQELSSLRYFDVQPNPFANFLTIRFQCEKAQEVRVVITDATGRMVWQQKTNATTGLNKLQWNAEPGSAGLYFVRLEGETETAVIKVVRQ